MAAERRLTPIRIPRPLRKKLAKKEIKSQGAITACIRQLRLDWHHNSLRTKKMQGAKSSLGGDLFEARATRADRVTFYWDGGTIVIENHCKHDIL